MKKLLGCTPEHANRLPKIISTSEITGFLNFYFSIQIVIVTSVPFAIFFINNFER